MAQLADIDAIQEALLKLRFFETAIAPHGKKFLADLIRRSKELPPWPPYCFVPTHYWRQHFQDRYDKGDRIVSKQGVESSPEELINYIVQCSVLFSWRISKSVYRFDDTVITELANTSKFTNVPTDVFLRLPEWAVFVDLSGEHSIRAGDQTLIGAWIGLDYDIHEEVGRIALLPLKYYHSTSQCLVGVLHFRLNNKSDLEGLIDDLDKNADPGSVFYRYLFSLIPFLCVDEPDIADPLRPGELPARPAPKRTRKGLAIYPSHTPRKWTVGANVGGDIRDFNARNDSATRRPHIRRAHYHGVWTGPKNGERVLKFNWWPPTQVGGRITPETFE